MHHQVGLLSRLLVRRHVNGCSMPTTRATPTTSAVRRALNSIPFLSPPHPSPPPRLPPLPPTRSLPPPSTPPRLAPLPFPSPAVPILTPAVAAAHLTVAAYLAVSTPNFDAAAGALFAPPGGRVKRRKPVQMPNQWSYTKEEISAHNTRTDCWVIIKDKVYDVTSYVEEHPGGDAILNNAGGDSTEGFFGPQHGFRVFEIIEDFCIGELKDS
uniref:Cytochrome b5 heme-binding domain-containing protein n=1 Tax=Oryza meridionalis TaxID=40149 RepID=A0A0E0EL78_9ORYZ